MIIILIFMLLVEREDWGSVAVERRGATRNRNEYKLWI